MSDTDFAEEMDRAADLADGGKFEESFAAYLAAAKKGSVYSQILIGWKFEHGEDVQADLNQAKTWYEQAAASGSNYGKFHLAKLYRKMEHYEVAFTTMEELAHEGYLPAIFRLGEMYMEGIGVPVNKDHGRYYRKHAAKHGHVWAKRYIAADLLKGTEGVFLIPFGFVKFIIALCEIFWRTAKDPHNTKALT